MSVEIKSAVSVAEMARMVGLSRARFYQLIGSAFPFPVHDVFSRRPFFNQELQTLCLEVRRRNCGIDGKPILFYARRSQVTTTMPRKTSANVRRSNISPDLLDGLRSLGLIVSAAQVEAAVKHLFPTGKIVDPAEVIRAVFIHLKSAAP